MGNVTGAVHRNDGPNFAPALAYVPMAEQSSSAAPVMSPRPRARSTPGRPGGDAPPRWRVTVMIRRPDDVGDPEGTSAPWRSACLGVGKATQVAHLWAVGTTSDGGCLTAPGPHARRLPVARN